MRYPALDVDGVEGELLLAAVDDCSPTALEEQPAIGRRVTLFFSDPPARDRARQLVASAFPHAEVQARDVDDGDWARRSQEGLPPVAVGRLLIVAGPDIGWPTPPSGIRLIIPPSTGFGTGHHATTRLCLRALQEIDLSGLDVLDVGTGSGILAIAAAALGARSSVGIDADADAIRAAEESRLLNAAATGVAFRQADLRAGTLPQADVVTANLTGALLVREAARLLSALRPGGRLIVSGLMQSESGAVRQAFSAAVLVRQAEDDGWLALTIWGDRYRCRIGVRHPKSGPI